MTHHVLGRLDPAERCFAVVIAALIHAAQAHVIASTHHPTVETVERAVAQTRAQGQRAWEAHALRARAEIAARGTPPDVRAAELAFREALRIARELGMRPLEAACVGGLQALAAG